MIQTLTSDRRPNSYSPAPAENGAQRILLCGPLPPQRGGGPISRGQLAAGFARHGRDVAVLGPITPQAAKDGDTYAAAHPELQVRRYELGWSDTMGLRPLAPERVAEERRLVEPAFLELVDAFHPDVVVIGRETFAGYVLDSLAELDLPAVLLLRGNPLAQMIRGAYPRDLTEELLEQFQRCDRMIAVAEYLARGLRTMGLQNVISIENAIHLDDFRNAHVDGAFRHRLAIPEGTRIVLAPSAFNERKRPSDVVDAARRLLERRSDVAFVMAGEGVDRQAVEQNVERLGLAKAFRFPGWVENSEMPRLMHEADAVVITSEAEGMSRVYLESMACGRVLVASDIAAARELIEDEVNGFLFPLGDASALAARIDAALGSPETSRAVGMRARATVSRRNVDNVVPLYLAEFDSVVAARR